MAPLRGMIEDPEGVDFTMRFVDRVARPDDPRGAAHQLATLVQTNELPAFLSRIDKILIRVGAAAGKLFPRLVISLARAAQCANSSGTWSSMRTPFPCIVISRRFGRADLARM